MAFQTGVASSLTYLRDKLVTFATTTLGWSNLSTGGTTVASTNLLSVAGNYLGVGIYNGTHLALNVASGHTPGADFYNQPNTAWRENMFPMVGPMTFPTTAYWFFGTSEYLHFVVEDVPGEFWHGTIGRLDRTYNYPGCAYACGTEESIYDDKGNPLRSRLIYPFSMTGGSGAGRSGACQINGVTKYIGNNSPESAFVVPSAIGYQDTLGTNPINHLYANNAFLGRTLLHPIYLSAYGDFGGTNFNSIIGVVKDFAAVKLDYIGGKGILALGDDDWYLFPIRKFMNNMNNLGASVLSTGYLGLAYRRVD